MGGFRDGGVVGCTLLALAACQSTPIVDLYESDRYYRSVGFETKVPVDRHVCVLPVVDARKPKPIEATGPVTVQMMSDAVWNRPVATMIYDIVRDEVEHGGLFAEVEARPNRQACLLQVSIVQFEAGVTERVTGRNTFATVALRVEVRGPEQPTGKRPLWLDRQFAAQQTSDIAMRPVSTPVLLGLALRIAMSQMLAAIDQSNVARSGVPLDVDR